MLIIYAHPNKDGYCGYILEQFKKQLNDKKIAFAPLPEKLMQIIEMKGLVNFMKQQG